MRTSRLVIAALVVPALLIAAPSDAASRKPVARVVTKAPVVKVEKAPVPEYTLLPNLGPCQFTILRYIAKYDGVYKVCG